MNKRIDYGECIDDGHDFSLVKQIWHCGTMWFEVKCDRCGYKKTSNHFGTIAELKKWYDFKKALGI